MDKLLKDKVAVITGGANGLGKATAFLFSEHGAKVVIVDVNQDAGNKVVDEITNTGGVASFIKTDISKSAEVNKMMENVVSNYGGIDILKGIFLCGQAAAKVMIEKDNGGVILNTSSVVGLYGNFGQSNYVASKAGVIGMTKTWARELGKANIRVNAIAPGFIKTEILKDMPEKIINYMKEKVYLKRMGEPDDIANAFLYLASDMGKYVNSTVLSVDGGVVV
jgi:3-oxoacyl-[acyl-carrier protein] reductase